jgi:hypothetical protein
LAFTCEAACLLKRSVLPTSRLWEIPTETDF